MKKIIALICIVGCMGMLFGCACDSKKSDDKTTAEVGSISVVPANSTETQAPQKGTKIVTAVPSQKTTKAPKTTKAAPKKTKAKGGNIIGSWTWEGGIFVYTFKHDGTGVYTTGSEAMHFKYKTKNNKVYITYSGDNNPVIMPYTVNGKTLILKDSNGDDVTYYKNKKHSNPNK
ncbi:MAG: hypothetical protein J6W35_00645 [Eubacterium sp.]|nr:hypothetical protein [Eubacterium sp.]